MYAPEIQAELIDNYKLRIPSFVWGATGVGKSSLIQQTTKLLGISMRDERATTLDPVDTRGVPSVDDGFTVFNIPRLLPNVDRDGEFGLFFIDELSSAQAGMQAALYQLTLDRKLGDYVLPDGWAVVAAGNRLGDRAVSYRQSAALANRFGHYEMEVSVQAWLDWGLETGVDEALLAFIKYRPALLHVPPTENEEHAFPTPRSWGAYVNKHIPLMTPANEFTKVSSFVGEAAAIEFNHFRKIIREVPTIEEILQHPMQAKISENLDAIHATTSVVLKHVDKSNFDTLMKYIARFPEEYQALFTLEAIRRDEDLAETAAYIKWATEIAPKVL